MNDSIKEGDGARLIESFKVALLYFKAFGHNNYSFSVIKLLATLLLEPEDSHTLVWERFVNTKGIQGRNISLDLHMEHLNCFLKELLKTLRSNLNVQNADRIAKAMNNIKILVDNTEKNLEIKPSTSAKNKADIKNSVKVLVIEMLKENPFNENCHLRKYDGFKNFDGNFLSNLGQSNIDWAKKKIRQFRKEMSTKKI